MLPGSAGVMPPPPLAASIAVFRSCIHFSFSSRVLRGEGEAQSRLAGHLVAPTSQGQRSESLCHPCIQSCGSRGLWEVLLVAKPASPWELRGVWNGILYRVVCSRNKDKFGA